MSIFTVFSDPAQPITDFADKARLCGTTFTVIGVASAALMFGVQSAKARSTLLLMTGFCAFAAWDCFVLADNLSQINTISLLKITLSTLFINKDILQKTLTNGTFFLRYVNVNQLIEKGLRFSVERKFQALVATYRG